MDKNRLDKNEKYIYDRLSKIEVDNTNIKRRVRNNLENKNSRRKKSLFASTGALALSLFLTIGVSAAVLTNSQWFMDKFNPTFKEIVKPIDMVCEDQGIRFELIAGQKYENKAIVYLSVQDISGQNRITADTSFNDGFFIGIKGSEASYGFQEKVVSFDKETNTIYYELDISADAYTPLEDSLRLGSSRIYFSSDDYKNEKIQIPYSDLQDNESFLIKEGQIWGGSNKPVYKDTKVLKTGNYSSMPHQNDKQWISNVGIIDNKLHIQVASKFNKEFGPIDPFFTMKDKKGEDLYVESSIVFLTDKDNNILDIEDIDLDLVNYKYEDYIFPLGEDIQDIYEIFYTGYVYQGLEGRWEIQTDLTDDSNNIVKIDKEIKIDNYSISHMILSPLGLEIEGNYVNDFNDNLKIELETKENILELSNTGGILDKDKGKFSFYWKSNKLIKPENIKSIIINDKKIPIK